MAEKRNLYIHLTDKCNLFCLHCYCGEKLIKKRQMTWDYFQNVVRLFVNEFEIITLTGGWFPNYVLVSMVRQVSERVLKNFGLSVVCAGVSFIFYTTVS